MDVEKFIAAKKKASPATRAPRPCVDFSGRWVNRLGSEMELKVTNDVVVGRYRTAVGEPSPTEDFPLSGFVSGDLIAFVVSFGQYDSLTAWVGQHTLENGVETIYTLWHLTKNIPEEEEPAGLWSGILAGANIFVRR